MRPKSQILGFIARFVGFFVYCMSLTVLLPHLAGRDMDLFPASPGKNATSIWVEALVTTGVVFLLAHGLIGECLCLLTAYPVGLLEHIRGNTCEPALPKYCRETAQALQRLRNGDGFDASKPTSESKRQLSRGGSHHQFNSIEFFFEIFSLELQLEFATQTMRVQTPSTIPYHVIYNLRNHFENLVDLGNIDECRAPIIRENIDILAQSGRECAVFAFTDVIPLESLCFVYMAGWLIALYVPVQHCNWFVQKPPLELELSSQPVPTLAMLAAMAALSTSCSMLTTILSQMWRLWDPFRKGTNTYGWTLGIATEIDDLLNEFDEYDAKELLRKHSYMDPSAYLDDMKYDGGSTQPGSHAQTV
ncbi:hypothetical protein JDV02_004073 [Purpureocillium takamizusanense]|uniref:Uncharacterized protein n=1 Tax=Purpureocillium takamizusanense TaxID=2060973 RepID=A0A9Q8QD02_9HYPO|nr:uncharacterized protein JDV02_004073 [Purpureocillium takamizusanense]UNI17753.1 hypothetical protein JDV02_004073 [Purpureocillium takamizusanense]